MHKIEQAIQIFLEDINNRNVDEFESLIEEFGDNCKKALRDNLLKSREDEPFTVRMSNIGKPLRQLMLEKKYGRPPMDADMKLRMTYGYIWESFLIFLIKAAGLPVEDGKQVSLDIVHGDSTSRVDGTYDITIDDVIYDIKSASPWSFDNKFVTYETIEADDPFGYMGQGFGYSIASGKKFGGWVVVDKSDGRIKVVEIPQDKPTYKALAYKYLKMFKDKLSILLTDDIPPCEGVIDETFYKKPTGNKILNDSCKFCDHKYKCHPDLQFRGDLSSQAKTKKFKYYTHIERPDLDES